MKIIFAGTPEFAVPSLQALIDSTHTVIAVYTQPDRPAGRGRKLTPSPVKQLALQHSIPVYQPLSLRDPHEQDILKTLDADLMIVTAYGLILPSEILTAPKLGCINVHASLLPRWRGAAPIQYAILSGDTETGITIMQMDKGLDTGNILYTVTSPIVSTDTGQTLHDKLAPLGATALMSYLAHPTTPGMPQTTDKATYAHKLTKAEANIDWALSAVDIDRRIRAFNPWPVAYTTLKDQTLRIWNSEVLSKEEQRRDFGTIIAATKSGIDVSTGSGIIRLLSLQLPGGKILTAAEFLNAHPAASLVGALIHPTKTISF